MLQRSSPYELLILDCDGVVVDSEPITMRVLTEMLRDLGVSIGPEEANERFIGTTFTRTLEIIAELLGGPIPEDFVPTYRDRTFAALEAELKPVAGIEAALDQIAIPYCIASNGPHVKMRKTLSVTSLLSRFEGRMFSSADVPRGKPFPDLFLHAAGHFGVSPAACLVIEDSTNGITAALAAGMSVYGFSGSAPEGRLKAAGAHRVFYQMSELPWLVAGIQ
jgi:HAD superfamily hydrolase (TIGR01509 family)